MKKFAVIIAILIFVLYPLSACDERTYDKGFEDGYAEGYFDSQSEHQDDYSRGYDDGFTEGFWMGVDDHKSIIIEEAAEYARTKTGWSVYEAWNSIGIYHEGVDPDGFELPTEEEYRECVETLVLFCEYLEGELP